MGRFERCLHLGTREFTGQSPSSRFVRSIKWVVAIVVPVPPCSPNSITKLARGVRALTTISLSDKLWPFQRHALHAFGRTLSNSNQCFVLSCRILALCTWSLITLACCTFLPSATYATIKTQIKSRVLLTFVLIGYRFYADVLIYIHKRVAIACYTRSSMMHDA